MRLRIAFLIASLGLTALLSAGCQSRDPADSSIPWGRPATWEDRVPGMGDF